MMVVERSCLNLPSVIERVEKDRTVADEVGVASRSASTAASGARAVNRIAIIGVLMFFLTVKLFVLFVLFLFLFWTVSERRFWLFDCGRWFWFCVFVFKVLFVF